uniref:Uncharacterized protein n=1 Tax=Anopheles culicifacies TaxID=139723 RepID=A0A182LY99_9DIPT
METPTTSDRSENIGPQLQSRFPRGLALPGKIYDTIALHRVCTTADCDHSLIGDARRNEQAFAIWYHWRLGCFSARKPCCTHPGALLLPPPVRAAAAARDKKDKCNNIQLVRCHPPHIPASLPTPPTMQFRARANEDPKIARVRSNCN